MLKTYFCSWISEDCVAIAGSKSQALRIARQTFSLRARARLCDIDIADIVIEASAPPNALANPAIVGSRRLPQGAPLYRGAQGNHWFFNGFDIVRLFSR